MTAVIEYRPWQTKEIADNALKPKRGLFCSPRTGKTLASETSLQVAAPALGLRRVLISCPLAVGPMWVRELTKLNFRVVEMFHEELVARAYALGKLEARQTSYTDPPLVIVMNEDVVSNLGDQLLDFGFDAVIVDESHHMRGVSSLRGMALRKLCWQAKWVRLLTGTPSPKHYGNLWGQLVALDRAAWGRSYHRDFKDRYLITDPNSQYQNVIIGTKNEDELRAKLLQYVTFVRREDVFGPDQYEYQVEWVELPDDAARSYRRLATEFILEDPNIDAKHVLTRITRLQQLASGYLPGINELGEPGMMEMHTAKIDAVMNTIDNITACDEKLVLYHRFKWEGERYLAACQAKFGTDIPIFPIRSKMKIDERDANCVAFQTTKGGAIVVAQTRTGGIGIDLCEANYVLRASQSFESDYEQQAVDRAFKPGEPRVIVDFRARDTVDAFIAETLKIGIAMDRAVMRADRESMVFGRLKKPKHKVA